MEWLESLDGIDELESAEAFLDYFGVAYDPAQVRISRLHIMHRFHQALSVACAPDDGPGRQALAARLLAEAYQAFAGIPVRDAGACWFDAFAVGSLQPVLGNDLSVYRDSHALGLWTCGFWCATDPAVCRNLQKDRAPASRCYAGNFHHFRIPGKESAKD